MDIQQPSAPVPRKRWQRVIPLAIAVYTFAYMDRSNIGFAIAGGMNKELHISATIMGMAAGIFFIGYLFLQVPGGHIAARHSAKKFVAASIVVWGVVATLSGVVNSPTQLLVLRFLLGVAEGGTFPAMLVLIGNWFPNQERARANAFFMMSSPIGYIITSPLSGWITHTFGWRYIFIIEGVLTVALVALWWPLMEDKPESAKWLSERERDYLTQTLQQEQQRFQATAVKSASYRVVLANFDLWRLSTIYFCYLIGSISFVIWLPTLIRNLTKGSMTSVGFLASVPYIAAVAGLYIFGSRSDKTGNRRLYAALPGFFMAAALLLAVLTKQMNWVSYACLVVCGFFQMAHNGAFWAIPPLLFRKEMAGGARGIINGVANLGGFVGPSLVGWFITRYQSPDIGLYVVCASLVLASLLTLTLPASLAKVARPNEAKAKGAGA